MPVTDRGFTLVELVVVLVVISIIAGLALPVYGNAVARYRFETAVHQVRGDLERGATHARATMTTVGVRFDLASHQVKFANLPSRRDAGVNLTLNLEEHPMGATIASASFGGTGEYSISPYGVPDSGGAVILAGAGTTRTIRVDPATARASIHP